MHVRVCASAYEFVCAPKDQFYLFTNNSFNQFHIFFISVVIPQVFLNEQSSHSEMYPECCCLFAHMHVRTCARECFFFFFFSYTCVNQQRPTAGSVTCSFMVGISLPPLIAVDTHRETEALLSIQL